MQLLFLWRNLPIVGTGRRLRLPVALYPGATAGGWRISGPLGGDLGGFMDIAIFAPGSCGEFWGYMEMGYPREVESQQNLDFRTHQRGAVVGVKKNTLGY